jgi:hypothetical protein
MLCLKYILYIWCMYILFKRITRMAKLPAFGHIGWLTHKVSVFHFISYTISLTYVCIYMLSILCMLYIVFINACNSSCARDTPMSSGCRRWAQDADDELRMSTMSSGCRRWAQDADDELRMPTMSSGCRRWAREEESVILTDIWGREGRLRKTHSSLITLTIYY